MTTFDYTNRAVAGSIPDISTLEMFLSIPFGTASTQRHEDK